MNLNIIPFYNILNMFFIGILFSSGIYILIPGLVSAIGVPTYLDDHSFIGAAIVLVMIYFMGFLIDRFASLFLEKILKNKNRPDNRNVVSQKIQMNWRNYDDYQKAEKHSDHIKTLAREYTFSRNSMTLFLILTVVSIVVGNWVVCSLTWIITVFLYFSTKKHADKISQRVDFYMTHKD